MNIIDIIILAILGLGLVSGMYKGLLASTLSLIGFVGAWFATTRLYTILTALVKGNSGIMTTLESIVGAVSLFPAEVGGMQVGDALASSAEYSNALNNLNATAGGGQSNDFFSSFIGKLFDNNVATRAFGEGTMNTYMSNTLASVMVDILALFVTMFIVYFAVLLIVNLFNNVFRFPSLKHFDALLGGVLGVVRGGVIVAMLFAVMPVLTAILNSMDVTIVEDLLNQSAMAGFFSNWTPLQNMIGGLLS